MKKITREEWVGLFKGSDMTRMWERIQELNSELEAMEGRRGQKGQNGMTVEEIEDKLRLGASLCSDIPGMLTDMKYRAMALQIQPLTAPQGFVVTNDMWEDCPTDTIGWQPVWVVKDFSEGGVIRLPMNVNDYFPRPLPPKVTRERTRDEKIEKLVGWIDWGYEVDSTLNGRTLALAKCSDSTLDDLCTVAGIPITTEEV